MGRSPGGGGEADSVVVILALLLTRPRSVIRLEAEYYRWPPGQASPFQDLGIAQFERLCLRLVEERGLRILSHGRPAPREIEIAAVGSDPIIIGGTYRMQGVRAEDDEVVGATQPPEAPPIELINGPRLLALVGQHEVPSAGRGPR